MSAINFPTTSTTTTTSINGLTNGTYITLANPTTGGSYWINPTYTYSPTYSDPVPREKTKHEIILEFIVFNEVESRIKMVLEKVAQKKLTAEEALELLKGDKNVVVSNG